MTKTKVAALRMKKIKILFTINNFDTSGSGKVLFDIASSLDREVFEPEICVRRTGGDFYEVVRQSGIKIHVNNFKTSYYPLPTLPYRIWKLSRFFRDNSFDIIHSWHWSSDFTEPLAARLAGVKWVYTKKSMSWGNRAWKIRSALADKIITINEEMNRDFFKNSGKAELIPLGLDPGYYSPDSLSSSGQFDNGLPVEEQDFKVVSVANFVPVKGIELLIDAARMVKADIPGLKLLLVGYDDNDYGRFLHRKVEEEGLQDYVFFTGKVLDVRPYLALADLFVIPTKDEGRREGMPMAPVEAMSFKTIVIGSNVSGINFVLKDFPELLFEPGSAKVIADKIRDVYRLPAVESQRLREALRQKVVDDFSIEKFIARHSDCYRHMIEAAAVVR